MRIDLEGMTVLVTGASRGIGSAIAVAAAGAGARVLAHYGHSAEAAQSLVARLGHGAQAIRADLEDPLAAGALWEAAERAAGRIHVLINNAGIAENAPLGLDEAEWLRSWNRTLTVNLTAAGLLTRRAVAHFRAAGGGRIINIASRAAFRGDTIDHLAYAASKAGMVALTRSVARGLGRDGVTAFTVAPGFTRTDMAQDFIDAYGEAIATRDLALNRLTEPEDIAPTVLLMASGLMDHATGCTVDINAGSYVR